MEINVNCDFARGTNILCKTTLLNMRKVQQRIIFSRRLEIEIVDANGCRWSENDNIRPHYYWSLVWKISICRWGQNQDLNQNLNT